MEKEFSSVRSARDIIIAAAMTLGGIIMVALPTSVSVNIFGCIIALLGILLFIVLKTEFKETGTGKKFRRVIKYYPASRKADIISALKTDPSKIEWKEDNSANGLMIYIYVCKSEPAVYVRVSEFIPYNYEPCSDWFTFTPEQAAALLK